MHNEGRERVMQPVHPKGRLGTLVLGTYTEASFLFCICMHTYKMKVPPQKDIYIQLSQSLQWLWNSNSAGRDLAFLFSCYLFFESITIFKRGEGGAAYGLEVGVEVFWLVLFFFVQYYNSWRSCWESSPFLAPSKRTISFWMVEATKHMVKVGGREGTTSTTQAATILVFK